MKEGIHPDYHSSRVACACGNSFVTRSTRGDMQIDVCYTGTQKLIDTAGRVDRFRKRYEKRVVPGAAKAAPPAEAVAKPAEENPAS
jgi:large subunit ribosomal protein L31